MPGIIVDEPQKQPSDEHEAWSVWELHESVSHCCVALFHTHVSSPEGWPSIIVHMPSYPLKQGSVDVQSPENGSIIEVAQKQPSAEHEAWSV